VKVLYVEDDPLDSDLALRKLHKSAAHISLVVARTRQEAMGILNTDPSYDLLLTDLHLPDGGGFDLLTYVRERGLAMAVVVITGAGDEETAVAVMKAGADDFVVKRQDYLSNLALT
jgi:response regulator of citrate/malate metabolism